MLKNKWFWVFSFFLLIAFIDALFLTYLHHWINIIQPDICPLCSSKYAFIDCEAVSMSKYATFLGIPVSSLGVFAYLFIILFLLAVFYLQKDLLKNYLSILYPILLLLLLFSLYELYASVFKIKALCPYCAVLYICIIVMAVSCKLAVQSSHKKIFESFYHYLLSLFNLKNAFNITLIVATLAISSLFAFGVDSHYKYKYSMIYTKHIDKQKDRVIEILKEMIK
jgi:uncharacterized membrane protein